MKDIKKTFKIFVAGHNGMAGKAICKSLKEKGYKNVITIERKDLDLTNFDKVKDFFENIRPDIVIIAAAKVGGIFANINYPTDFLLRNLQIQNNLIYLSMKYDVNRLLFLGSSCIYPKFAEQPIKEESLLAGPLESSNEYYAVAKIAGIKLCQALRKEYNFDAICLMPNNLYGPGDNYNNEDSHVLASLVRKYIEAKRNNSDNVICWGTGKPLREFLYSEDLGDACTFALENWFPSNPNSPKSSDGKPLTILNVSSGEEISIKNLAKMIQKYTKFKGITKWDHSMPDGTPKKQLDISRLSKLGWCSNISLEQGLKKTINLMAKRTF